MAPVVLAGKGRHLSLLRPTLSDYVLLPATLQAPQLNDRTALLGGRSFRDALDEDFRGAR
jgi:hypothetical protein